MWTPLLLILSLAASSLGSSVPLVVYKQPNVGSTTVYQFKLNTYAQSSPSDGYEMINGENKEGREFTYVRVYPYLTYEGPEGTRNFDSFDKKLSVCRMDYDTHRGRVSTHLLSGIGCNRRAIPREANIEGQLKSISDTNQDFYVSTGRPKRVHGTRVTLTQCLQQSGQLLFTSLVEGNAACPQGSEGTYSESFWVVAHNGIACPDIKDYNGLVRSRDMVDGVFPSRVTKECNVGYQVDGRSEVTCNNGRWSDDLGTCEKVSCGRPRNIDNGFIRGFEYTYESRVQYFCDEGYDLKPEYSQTRTCEHEGTWTPRDEPRCEKKSCGSPGDLIYGELILEGERYGDMARYRCDDGYRLIGNPTRQCTKEGTWTGRTPACDRITCEPLQQPRNGQHDGSSTSNFASGSVVAFKCHEGYKIDGAEILRCGLDATGEKAQWSNPAPLCNAITCKEPQVNSNVEIEGSDYTYGKTIKFKCKDGFRLTGTSIATCTATGWDQQPPSCSAKSCNNPGIPDNGTRTGDNFNAYSTVTFSCTTGFELTPPDSATIICLPNTRWNKPSPFCEPVKCPTLQRLENGRLSTELFQYGQTIIFQCFPGYQLQGNTEISCQASGTWDKDMPQCTPCPRNHYKPGVNQDTCKSCPVRSITLSTATTSIDHCMCEEGSSKQDDGNCVAIRCIPLTAPENGAISECQPSSGSQCTFSCNPGYILSGARERRCTETGWTGRPPVCTACPANTYKAAEGSQTCIPCPVNSHTDGKIGEALESCVCKDGYKRTFGAVGGCYDINECLEDNGGCEDRCANTEGGYYCQCMKPGYELNDDGKTCNMTRTCAPLGQKPEHGNSSCTYNVEQNGYICHFQCEAGYYFVSGLNNYVTCGPETDFRWSHQLMNETAKLPACTKEFFVDTQIPLTFDYLTEATCEAVYRKRPEILKAITNVVLEFEVCKKRGTDGCGLKYLVMNCSDQQGEDQQGEDQRKVDLSFEIYLKNTNQGEVGTSCDTNCLRSNMREMLGDTLTLKTNFEAVVKDEQKNTALEEVPDVDIRVDQGSFTFGRPRLLCVDEGRVYTKKRLCVPCGKGTFLPKKDSEMCTPCPIGFYQSKEGQSECIACHKETTTAGDGSDHPALCSIRVFNIEGTRRRKRSLDVEPSLTKEEVEEILSFLD